MFYAREGAALATPEGPARRHDQAYKQEGLESNQAALRLAAGRSASRRIQRISGAGLRPVQPAGIQRAVIESAVRTLFDIHGFVHAGHKVERSARDRLARCAHLEAADPVVLVIHVEE